MRRLLNCVVLAVAVVSLTGCVHIGECGPRGVRSRGDWLFEDDYSDGRAERHPCLIGGPPPLCDQRY